MTSTARTGLAATAVFAAAGGLAGVLADERGGLAGGVVWVSRTLVVVAAVVGVAAGLALAWGVRRRYRILALAAFAFFVAQPVLFAVYLTHLPARQAVHDAALGAPKEPVTLTTADGLALRGWYVPSRNGAAVALLHGTGGNRLGVATHARLLSRHGYGVLLFDLRGHGASDGRSTSLPSTFARDADAALAFLQHRPDVRDGRIAVSGVSLGGEVALEAIARRPGWRAAVLEGVEGGASVGDLQASAPDLATGAVLASAGALAGVLSGSRPDASNPELVARSAPRPLLLLSAGRGSEARANEAYRRIAGGSAELWNLPAAGHAAALRTTPDDYERRVVAFLDRALG